MLSLKQLPMSSKFKLSILIVVLGSSALVSCASSRPSGTGGSTLSPPQSNPAPEAVSPSASKPELAPLSEADSSVSNTLNNAEKKLSAPKANPQLVKTAVLSLVVKSVPESAKAVTTLVNQQQGDILDLSDQPSTEESTRHTLSIELRVPAAKLEPTLNALAKLGSVQQRSLKAEDVSSQLVDFDARLKNLRRTEASLLEIMERSGWRWLKNSVQPARVLSKSPLNSSI
jgi:Domain of unknown function (DUF4349)